jgi:HAD superfamily hydrolase (TIGR01490 family)
MARAIWWNLLYKVAWLDMDTLADKLVSDLAGDSESDMIEKCRFWYQRDIAPQVAPAAVTAMKRHRDRGDLVVMLTSSTQYVAEVVAASLEMDHTLCSRLEVKGGAFTGRVAQLCFGRHKVPIAERFAADRDIDLAASAFYSDSYNDLPMLLRVGRPVAVNPDARLRRHAKRAGWAVEHWASS